MLQIAESLTSPLIGIYKRFFLPHYRFSKQKTQGMLRDNGNAADIMHYNAKVYKS